MFLKTLLIIITVQLIFCYEKEGNVLVLHDSDFPQVFQDHKYIMIEFYAPWCGHCNQLAPIYAEAADELEAEGSPIKLGKVDATVEQKITGQYKVQGYPTIFFFYQGKKVDYNGQRTKQAFTNWLKKKIRDPLVPIDETGYQKIQTEQKVSIVFHGDASSDAGKIINKLAVADDYNTYYVANVGKKEGSVEIFRPFGEPVSYESVDSELELEAWIRLNQRPIVVPFDQRTIGEMFGQYKPGVCLFNKEGSNALLEAFTESANAIKKENNELTFVHIDQKNNHMMPFAEYMKVEPSKHPVVLIEAKIKSKFVLIKNSDLLTADDITSFVKSWISGDATKFGLTDEVKIETESEDEKENAEEKTEEEKNDQL